MPAQWIKDHSVWDKAKKAVMPHAGNYDEPYAVVAHVYKQMGGRIKGEVAAEDMPILSKADEAKACEDMPEFFKKSEAVPSSTLSQLTRAQSRNNEAFQADAKVDDSKREVDVVIVTEGPGNEVDKNYYTDDAIKDGVAKFEGARAFINHQTEDEREQRPEQDVREMAGFYKDCKLVKVKDPKQGRTVNGIGATFVADQSEAGDEALSKARAQVLFKQIYPESKECYAGISINTGGWQDGTIDINGEEWAKIVAFEGVRSADIVTRPARGGAFVKLAESMGTEVPNNLKESEMKNAEKIRQLVTTLEESEKAARKATEPKEKERLMAESAKHRENLKLLVESEDEEEAEGDEEEARGGHGKGAAAKHAGAKMPKPPKMKKPKMHASEDDDGDDDGDGDGKGGDVHVHMDNLKKAIPQSEGESEDDYMSRIQQAMTHAKNAGMMPDEDEDESEDGEGEGEAVDGDRSRREAGESESVRKFRKESPVLYRQLMASMRESLGAERHDFAGLRNESRSLRIENGNLKLQIALGEAERELEEAGIPARFLAPADLVKLDESARKREIARTKMLMESSGAIEVWGGGPGEGHGEQGLDYAKYSIPTKSKN